METNEDTTQQETPQTAVRRPGRPVGSAKQYNIPVEVIAERLPQVKLTKRQLKQLAGEPIKREMTEKQKEAAKASGERLRRWQAERRAKKEEETANLIPLLSAAGPRKPRIKGEGKAPAAAPVPPSEPVSEESDSDPEVTETELSTTDAEAAGLGPARRRVTRPTKAAVKQLAVVNRALGAPAPAQAPPAPQPSPWASMLNTVWRPR